VDAKRFLKYVADIGRLARAVIEQEIASRAEEHTRESIEKEVESWGVEIVTEEEMVYFILDDDFGLPEGYEWTEPAVYETGTQMELTCVGDKMRTFLMPDGTLRYEEFDQEDDDES